LAPVVRSKSGVPPSSAMPGFRDLANILLGSMLGIGLSFQFLHPEMKPEMPSVEASQKVRCDCSLCATKQPTRTETIRNSSTLKEGTPFEVQMAPQPRKYCIAGLVENCSRQDCSHKDIYQFGIFKGASMRNLAIAFRAANANFSHMWGFDSFQGLPDDGSNVGDLAQRADVAENATQARPKPEKIGDYNYFAKTFWFPGAMDVRKTFASSSFLDIVDTISRIVDDPRANYLRGFFNESLTEATFRLLPFQPALYVDIDVDLYSSTVQVLEWLLTFRLLVPGTVIYYDDWRTGGSGGNQKAHYETLAKFPGLQVRHFGVQGERQFPGCFVVARVP